MILSIAKKLPKPVRESLRWLYHKWKLRVKWNRSLIKNLAEYFVLSEKEVVFYLKAGVELNAHLWKVLHPRNKEEIEQFYSFTPYYIFELAHWHMQKYQRDFRKEVISHTYGNTLDYGAGIGDLCIELAKKGLSVTYTDVGSRTFEFAKWLFKKHNLSIKMIDVNKESLTQQYDTIICIDVIEHVFDPRELLKDITSHIKKEGHLIITNLNVEEVLENYPMHFKVEFGAEEYLRFLGFYRKEFPWLWIKS